MFALSFRFFSFQLKIFGTKRGKNISIHLRVVGSILTFQLPESITVKEDKSRRSRFTHTYTQRWTERSASQLYLVNVISSLYPFTYFYVCKLLYNLVTCCDTLFIPYVPRHNYPQSPLILAPLLS